ncbi:ABC transporter ATP-binding protein [Glaciecola sp. XM2]|uniref:ABC transporter ATP-binding protein n=1 Tax=Glaciecola sp. XM2 TaxID=1914931 RepID=UPI001BDDF548|nr:ABC transporter ATP-binding protein [Glaciecola sp. XM2]MBT1452353.1 ABC transporter ATP-binding protein [Glaciecola sp. XM2]
MISVNQLCKRFGEHVVVDDLSFSVNPGDIVGFLGPNGAGKSTTMKMITGFLPATSGSISVAGQEVTTESINTRRLIGYLPEGAPAYAEMTVYQFLVFIAQAREIPKSKRSQAIDDVISKVSLQDVLYKQIDTLSKGFKRRVGIAQALIHDPQILILDEPTDGLDPNQKKQVRELIANLAKEKIVIISTHILEEVTAVCNRAIIIAQGKKRFDDTPTALQALSRYHNAISLTLSYMADISGLLEIEGVADLAHDPQHNRITVFSEQGQSILQEVSNFIQRNKLPVETLSVEQGRLDEVFTELTSAPKEATA